MRNKDIIMAPPKKQLSIEEYRLHEKSFIAEEEEGEENNDQKKQKVEDIPRISYHPKFTEQLPTPPTELTPLEQLTQNLYVYHITREIELLGYDIPDCVGELIESNYTDLIFKLADDFKSSPQRLWVSQQARAVDLNTLNFKNFADLLTSLFQVSFLLRRPKMSKYRGFVPGRRRYRRKGTRFVLFLYGFVSTSTETSYARRFLRNVQMDAQILKDALI